MLINILFSTRALCKNCLFSASWSKLKKHVWKKYNIYQSALLCYCQPIQLGVAQSCLDRNALFQLLLACWCCITKIVKCLERTVGFAHIFFLFLVIRSLGTHSSLPSVKLLSFHSRVIFFTFYSILDLSSLVFRISWERESTQINTCPAMWPWADDTVKVITRSLLNRHKYDWKSWDQQGERRVKGPVTSSSSSITGRALYRRGGGHRKRLWMHAYSPGPSQTAF